MRLVSTFLLLWLLPLAASARQLPSTDLFVTEVEVSGDEWQFSPPVNLTERDGYDNQPAFVPRQDAVLFTSIRMGDQADVYRLNLSTGYSERVTATPRESEYSPTPLVDGSGFSVVRVEADGTQRLWRFDHDGSRPGLLIPQLQPVGYHAWLRNDLVALFILGDPPTLQIFDFSTGFVDTVAVDIGRSLRTVPGRQAVSFIDKQDPENWWIAEWDAATELVKQVAPVLPGREDHERLADGSILMADGSRIFRLAPGAEDWEELADFAPHGVSEISRLAMNANGNRLVFVATTE